MLADFALAPGLTDLYEKLGKDALKSLQGQRRNRGGGAAPLITP